MKISAYAISAALRAIDPAWRLAGRDSLSRRATSLSVVDGAGERRRLVLLTHGERDRARNPELAHDEYRLLGALRDAGLPAAQPLHLARGHQPPFLIVSAIAGAPRYSASELPAFCAQLAETLSAIHAVDIGRRDLGFLPRQADLLAAFVGGSEAADDRIGAALRREWGAAGGNAPGLLHGDFWLGNLLWEAERLSGIVDWEDAALGDPLADLGKSRLEMLWALGERAMALYTAQYLALNRQLDTGALPFWDLAGAARLAHFASFASDAAAAAAMRVQYEGFVDAALAALKK